MPTPCAHEADISLLNTAIVEIKDTLKDLKELLLSNAVLSEQVSHFKESITNIDIRLRKLELDVAQGKGSNRWIERVVWILLTGTIGILSLKEM
jgi:hypothetical protein|nr:MAG TPA: hypothetical protein [Caudoviricetes sp.]